MGDEIFCKRPGTTDLGKDYEDQVIAYFILKLITKRDENIVNFKLSSNDSNFGDFDDVVLEVDYKNGQETYAFQLKHVTSKNKTLTLKSLQDETGNFSIKKYFKSLGQIKDDCKLILSTNLATGITDKTRIRLADENFDIEISKYQLPSDEEILDTSESGTCYRFQIKENNGWCEHREKYKKFFDRFFLFVKQANVKSIKDKIISKFQEEFSCKKNDAEKYLLFISEWSKLEGKKVKLDKTLMQQVITLIIVTPFIKPLSFGDVNDKMKLLREAICNFNVTFLEEQNQDVVKRLWGDQTCQDTQEIKNLKKKYQLINCKTDDEVLNKLLWLMGKCPLIVVQNETTSKAIKLCPHQKYVVLGTIESNEFPNFSTFQNLADVRKTLDLYDKIVTTFACSMQGKEESTLKFLIGLNEEFETAITTNELTKMLDGPYRLGEDKETILPPYVSRSLSRNLVLVNYFENVQKNTLIVLDNTLHIDKIKKRLSNFNRIQIHSYLHEKEVTDITNIYEESHDHTSLFHTSPNLKKYVSGPDIYESKNETSSTDFSKLCQRNPSAEKYHHFRIVDDQTLEWIRSKGDISDLEQYRVENQFVEEDALAKVEPGTNINLIVGDPGMGKSKLLMNLKNKTSPKFWAIFLHSKDITLLCERLEGIERRGHVTELVEFILDVKYDGYPNFDRQIIKMMIENHQVVYFWDALDEVTTQNLESVTNLIEDLSEKSTFQWVTSRCHLKKQLEKKFNVLGRNMRQFNEEEQTLYIHERLDDLYSDEHVKEIIEKIRSTVTLVRHNDVLGIPLQIFMLTELFRQDHDKYFKLLKDVFSLTDLYHHIIEEKFNVYYQEKAGVRSPNDALKQVLQGHKKSMFEKYEKAALRALVTKELFKRFNIDCNEFLEEIQGRNDSIGLITEVTDNFPQFLHNSYAEYFVATYFVEHHKEIPNFESILFDKKYANIRFFFDLLTAKSSSAHIAVLYKNLELLKQYKDELKSCEDEEGRNVLQLACSWGQRYSILSVEYDNGIYIIDNEHDESVSGETPEYIEMLHYLLENCDASDSDNLFNVSSLSYAEKTDCLLAKLKILLRQDNDFAKLKTDDGGISILYYSAKFGYDEVLDLFKDLPFIKTKKNNFSLIHIAVTYCQEEYLRKLLSIEVYREKINDVDKYGRTALYQACSRGSSRIVKFLIESGADVNFPTRTSCTPLHVSSLYAYDDIVQLLVTSGANTNAAKAYGITPLHVACWNGNHTTVHLLLKSGVSLNLQADDGCTPLYVASRNKHDKVVKRLLEVGAEIDLPQNEGVTPLLIASQEGHERNVELLLEAGANVHLVTNTGESPLYVASQNGHATVVEMLIGHGANVDCVAGNGWTPLRIACQLGYLEVVEMLVRAGAKFDAGCTKGSTPLTIAKSHGHESVVRYLRTSFGL